ncbi:MAG: proton-conducting transporter membrane subunit [Chloroflexi bacterium]|nr:proton-conducting transporter membrane subunit [Chloroflexota bacterium]
MNWWLVLPIAWPFLMAFLGLLAFGHERTQRLLAVTGAFGQLAAAIGLVVTVGSRGIQVMQVGDWPAPFGITLVADHFSAFTLLAGATASSAATAYAAMTVDVRRARLGYFSFAGILVAAVAGAFLTGDLFNLFVWFEVMLISSFVLLALGRRPEQAAGATTYVTLNLIASAMFLVGAGLAYALTGTLNFADLAQRLPEVEQRELVIALAILLLAAFGSKSAAYPLSAWLPASYHTPAPDVTALFAGLLTKVGVYAVARSVTLFFADESLILDVVLAGAGLTMVVGVLGALAQYDIRRLLSFHIASQVGYMLMGIGLFTPLALAGTAFYMAQHMVTKTALFLVAGVVETRRGTGDLHLLGGMYRTHLPLAMVFALAALSLAGVPPFAGFVAKFTLARAGVEAESWTIVAISLVVGLLTLLSMVKIWIEVFWKEPPEGAPTDDPEPLPKSGPAYRGGAILLPGAILALVSVGMGLFAGPLVDYAMTAGEELSNSAIYVDAVLGGTR